MSSTGIFAPELFAGKVVVLSGGGSGIGRVTALQFAALGASVVICGRRAAPLEETVELWRGAQTAERSSTGSISAAVCDVREEDQVDAFMNSVIANHGRLDVLVNNAGGQFMAPAEAITPKGFRTVIRLNVEGTWLMTHAAATKAMIPQGGGRVISVTLSPHSGLPSMVHAGAARAAVENLMKTLSIEWARHGIRCNAIAPGQIGTEVFWNKYPRQVVEKMATTIPVGRLGRPEEIAATIAFLASPPADFISGATITVDGARDNWLGTWPPSYATDRDGEPVAEERHQ